MSADVTVSATESDFYKALGDFLQGLFSNADIRQSQQNRDPMPAGDFITMTALFTTGLSTSVVTYTAPEKAGNGEQHITRTTRWHCQLDFYGQSAAARAMTVATVVRTPFACDWFRANAPLLTPLWADDPHQTTMINGEQQYEPRWTLDVVAQINPVVTAPLAFFDSITLKTLPVEAINAHSNQ